jgi:hypothetical protein
MYTYTYIYKVDCPRQCNVNDLSHTLSECSDGKVIVNYVWNATKIENDECVPKSSYPLPSPYEDIPCGMIPLESLAGSLVIFFACIVGALGVTFVGWLYMYRKTTVVKLAQAGHTAVFCFGGVFLQFSWMTYLGPVTKVHYLFYLISFVHFYPFFFIFLNFVLLYCLNALLYLYQLL